MYLLEYTYVDKSKSLPVYFLFTETFKIKDKNCLEYSMILHAVIS